MEKMEEGTTAATTEKEGEAGSSVPNPFDDPVQRTKCLIQYIRLRKQRAEAEQAKRNALKKQKMDARATLQSAREEKAIAEAEEQQCAMKIEELNEERHQTMNALKAIHSRETERKKKREEQERRRLLAEEQFRQEEQRRLAAQQQQQQQRLAEEYILQLKSAQQALNVIIASATGGPGASPIPPSLLSLLIQNPTTAGVAPSPAPIGASPSLSSVPFMHQPQQQQSNKLSGYGMAPSHPPSASTPAPPNPQSTSSQPLHIQQQQVQNAVAQLLRQNFTTGTGISGLLGPPAGPLPQQTLPPAALGNYAPQLQQQLDLQALAAAATHHQQFPSALNIQQALAAAAASGGPPSGSNSLIPPGNVPPGFSPDLLYQAALLAAANLGSQPTGIIPSTSTPQQQRPK